MGYHVLGEAAMALHFAFLAYIVVGGFLAWYWPKTIWTHLVCAAYGLGVTVIGWPCPLTRLENWGRLMAGEQGLTDEGFIAHYLTGVIYPADHLLSAQLAAAATVVLSWIGLAWITRRRAVRSASQNQHHVPEPTP